MLHLTLVTQSKQSTGAKVRILQQEKQSTLNSKGTQSFRPYMSNEKREKRCVTWLFALHNLIKNKGRKRQTQKRFYSLGFLLFEDRSKKKKNLFFSCFQNV